MVRPLQLATIGAFLRVIRNQSVMGTPVVTAGFGNFILLDSHVSTFAFSGPRAGIFTNLTAHTPTCARCPIHLVLKAGNIG